MSVIADEAKARLKEKGVNQWQRGTYPDRSLFIQDVADGIGYVVVDDDEVLAQCAITFTDELSYRHLTSGSWLTPADARYATIHRSAVSRKHQGNNYSGYLFAETAKLAKENQALSIRIDTHPDNLTMQHTLERAGFVKCGTLILQDGDEIGDPRLAYELLL